MIRYTLLALFVSIGLSTNAQSTIDSLALDENTYLLEQATFKVYSTSSSDNFLKLDTRNGKIWILQLHSQKEYRFTSPQND